MMRKLILLMTLAVVLNSCKSEEKDVPATLIDMKSFFKNGEKSKFRISPDGNYFSYLKDYNSIANIFVQKVSDSTVVRVTNDTLRSIYSYFWKGDRIVYAQDIGGDENFQLFSVKADGTDLKALTPFAGIRSDIVDDLHDIEGKENVMLVQINKRVKEYFDPYLLNIETGELKQLYDNQENFDYWFTDNNGIIRLASKTDGVNVTWNYRGTESEPFTPLLSTTFKEFFNPAAFDKDNKNFYATSNVGRDKITAVEYDPTAKKEIKEWYGNENYDIHSFNYDRKKQKITSVLWDAEKPKNHFFDKEWGDIQKSLEKKFDGYEVNIVSYTDDRTKAIVWTGNDRMPGKYYIYDFNTKETKEAANPYPWIQENQMAYVKPIKYTSRDGLEINGYLTLPLGLEAKNLPVITYPHGGPWARDVWGFNPEIQFLANRGYAVLQMNFRGSTGYGKKFWMSSFKQWGKTMQDDITDGVQWLINEGIADKSRIGIYGGSYGGYATLAGITFTPDLYAAAVDFVGVSNLFTFLHTIPPYWKPYLDQFHEMVGDPKKDSLLLAEASPALHADKIKTPLFIAQGANDPRVNIAESDQMVEALKKRGIDVEYMVKKDEGHGFINQENQFDFYSAMEKFLDKHMKTKKQQ
jgi:dipeptidyl aminopeptidase/acylaminoacyl peptidase